MSSAAELQTNSILIPKFSGMPLVEKISVTQKVSMGDAYYDSATLSHFWIRWRFGALRKNRHLLPAAGASVLEIGCGNGVVMRQLEDEFEYVADGCDLNIHVLERIVGGRGRRFYYDILELNPAFMGRYEAVFLLDVIEHIQDDVSFLRAAAAHVKQKGIVILNVPAAPVLFSRYDIACGHKRRYTRSALRKLIGEAGLEPLVVDYWGGMLFPLLLLRRIVLRFTSPAKAFQHGFDPPGLCINRLLQELGKAELSVPFSPPFGSSLIAIARVSS
jgi:SAM-dependent methyltransferase